MTYSTTCTHPDAAAYRAVPCGNEQIWFCETIGGCGGEFTVTKKHAVMRFVTHAVDCTNPRRGSFPAEWCGCEVQRAAGCTDCDKEFPLDVQPGPEVDIFTL